MKFIPIILILLFSKAYTQNSLSLDDQIFAFNVSQINEFIKRFNGVPAPSIVENMGKESKKKLKRRHLVLSLFDRDSEIETALIISFVNQVTSPSQKQGLSFYDDNWYAKLTCNMDYKGTETQVVLTLNVETSENYASKWVIRGVEADFLNLDIEDDKRFYLHPASEGTDFMNIKDLFSVSERKVKGFLYQNFHEGKMALFIHELTATNLRFNYIEDITYHFLQIDGWVFKVHKTNRKTMNSGWLMSELMNLSNQEKASYRKEILYLD